MTSIDQMVQFGKLRVDPTVKAEAPAYMKKAKESLLAAGALIEEAPSWTYTIAYTAAFQATTGLMHAMGYRVPSAGDSHQWTVTFAREVVSSTPEVDMGFFEQMRTTRHKSLYAPETLVTQAQAERAMAFAEKVVALVETMLDELSRNER